MPKYNVSVTVEVEKRYWIEADSEDEAIDAAEMEAQDDDYGWDAHDVEVDCCHTRIVGHEGDGNDQ